MIDIHSHLLFGIDDGAKSLEDSIVLLKQAEKIGYTDIVCSSHFYMGRYENKNYDKNFDILKQKIKEENIKINLYKGNEITFMEGIFSKLRSINSINNGNYILVEFKRRFIFSVYKTFLKTLLDLEYRPILAHIERYPFIKFEEFKELYNMGIIFQMNIKSIDDLTPKMKYFLQEGYIKVIATDTHNVEFRNYDLDDYFKKLEKLVGVDKMKDLIYENPKKILNNENIILELKGEKNETKKIDSSNGLFKSIWNKLFSRA